MRQLLAPHRPSAAVRIARDGDVVVRIPDGVDDLKAQQLVVQGARLELVRGVRYKNSAAVCVKRAQDAIVREDDCVWDGYPKLEASGLRAGAER